MKKNRLYAFLLFALLTAGLCVLAFSRREHEGDDAFLCYVVDIKKQDLRMFWKDEKQERFKNFLNVKNWLEARQKELIFAMNGGMYKEDYSPQGLYVENQKQLVPLDTTSGKGNFYLKPNGVFYYNASPSEHITI